jgi:AcrR family transcriptional regulator
MATSDTRERILRAALDSFLANGYEQTTVAAIREGSGVSNGALFHHFASKEAVAEALYVKGIASFQDGLWKLLDERPGSLRSAVLGTIGHQLRWVRENVDLARFVYMRGHLDWSTPGAAEVAALNDAIGAAFAEWLAPLVRSGEIRASSMLVISAIVNGPAHAIARRWLAGYLDGRDPVSYAPELADAACAGLSGASVSTGSPAQLANESPPVGRVTLELLDESGAVTASGTAMTELLTAGTRV